MNKTSIALPKFRETIEVPVKTLKKYEGTFGADGFPLKLKIFEKGGVLYLQAEGQQAFGLESYSQFEFGYLAVKVFIEFSEDGKTMEFIQGKKYILKKSFI